LDPNYFGASLAILLAYFSVEIIEKIHLAKTRREYTLLFMPLFALVVACVVTFSRSGYIACLVVLGVLGFRYMRKLTLISLLVLIPLALSIPRVRERVGGLLSFDITSQQRVDSWQRGADVAVYSPVVGSGYGTYRAFQEVVGNLPPGSKVHSGAATDSTLFTMAIGSGVVGLAFVTALLVAIAIRARAYGVRGGAVIALVCSLLIHSQIVNSLVNLFVVLPFILFTVAAFMNKKRPDRHYTQKKIVHFHG
jgi:O-antigen ligase